MQNEQPIDRGDLTDGFHTFNELYEHRHALFMVLMLLTPGAWKSKYHADHSSFNGWFVAGLVTMCGQQITYHLPDRLWDKCPGKELSIAPIWDGHQPKDVVERLFRWIEKG